MSNDEDEFEFSDSTAVDLGAADYLQSESSARIRTLLGHSSPPPIPPSDLEGDTGGTERQEPPADWDDDGGHTAALDVSSVNSGEDIASSGEDIAGLVLDGPFAGVESAPVVDPHRTMALDVGREQEAVGTPELADAVFGVDPQSLPFSLDNEIEERTQLSTPAYVFDTDDELVRPPPIEPPKDLSLVSVTDEKTTAVNTPEFDILPDDSSSQASEEVTSVGQQEPTFSPYGPAGDGAASIQLPEESKDVDSTMMFDASELLKPRLEGPQGVITVLEGNDAGKEYFLRGEATVVGRGLDCDLVLNDASVSRRHFRLDRHGDTYTMIDLGSGNGTKVNGTKVSEIVLKRGADISIGTTRLQFGFVGSEERAPVEKVVDLKTAGTGLKLGFVVLLCLVVVGGVWLIGKSQAWWSATEPSSRPVVKTPVDTTKPKSEAEELAEKSREYLAKKDLMEAAGTIDALESQGGDPDLVSNLRLRLSAAQTHRKVLEAEKTRLMRGDPQEVITSLEVIPSTSPYYTAADELRDQAQQMLLERLKESAYDLRDSGKRDQARVVLNRVLSMNPDDGEAKALMATLDKPSPLVGMQGSTIIPELPKVAGKGAVPVKPTVTATPAGLASTQGHLKGAIASGTTDAKPATRAASANATQKGRSTQKFKSMHRKNSPKRKGSSVGKMSKKSPKARGLRKGYSLYSSRKFSAAAAAFQRASEDASLSNQERAKAAVLAPKVRQFATLFSEGRSAADAFQPSIAIPKLKKAATIDKAVSGTFAGDIRRKLAKMYAFKAAGAYSSSQYRQAAQFAKKALGYNKGEASARLIREKVEGKVGAMMSSARRAKSNGNLRLAERQLTTILGILSESDARAKQARRMLNEILASRVDDDDD
ncbi:MAG: FHA domain-containing protein [Myxococcota bacterium]|nr:FHA domain-containing protein [Myxococcota bacterium]